MMKLRICCVLFLISSVVAQSRLPSTKATYTVKGQVTDSTGPLIPGAQVRIKDPDIVLARSRVTNEAGVYEVAGLPPGRYVFHVDLLGFSSQSREIELGSGENVITVNFVLRIRASDSGPGVSTVPDYDDIAAKQRQADAELLVEQLFGWSSRKIWAGESQTPTLRDRQQTITKEFRMLNKEGVAGLLLGLKDPDEQLRRNASLLLLDLAGGFSVEARPRLSMPEALPALTEARTDTDPEVRMLIEEVIREIR
jgi:hypothetical protein